MIKFAVLLYCNLLEYNDCPTPGGHVCLAMNAFDSLSLTIYHWCSDTEIYTTIKKIFGICNANR
ncbi:hypothetical protein D6Z01_24405 [Salmonella enterica]|uniref:Uncharacterized protein n=10 Tax=Salmonella enterica TaxID=28901 RepID=A0A5V7P5X6_SALET|nr:hypothetical protein SEECH997_005040 [Salmonella enterica subsp. enterica serovar Chester str. ATCC 11997]APY69070.1 hypothetical protein LFZ23_14180 [Salmonella enterica subsp. enterica serovar Koessen str. S-1501]ASD87346.1 hypothetical protein LFZ16_14535 [Salmonella enterica subsp. enterica serovar India str. SA20085604]AUM30110.1 hypothetical protein LM70_05055 [Salmonella enterica subsp. enterica serovar Give]AUM39378.1 hypothetical protein SEEP1673_005365 [Salmonella enterica subsp. e